VSNRTLIVLVAIAAALFAFIYFYDRDRMTTSELEGRKDRVFVEFKPELVEALEIQGAAGEKISLVRSADVEGTSAGAEREWRIEAPRKLKADGSAVREVLSALDFLIKQRVVVGAGERGKPQYGFGTPAVRASFTIGGAKTSFVVGSQKGSGDTVYLAVDGRSDELYAVEVDFRESLDKRLDDLRDKHLVEGSLDDAIAIEVDRGAGKLSLARDDEAGPWRISLEGAEMLAADDQVAALLADVAGLLAQEFVADGADGASLGKYGLDAPTAGVAIRRASGKDVELLVGKPCPGDGRVHAAVKGSGTIACVADGIGEALARPAARFTETRPLVFAQDGIETVKITRGGASLVLERDADAGWKAAGHEGVAIDPDAVAELLGALREPRAKEALPGAEAIAGLGPVTASVELVQEAGRGPLRLDVFAADPKAVAGGGQRARRGGEEGVLVFAADPFASLRAELLAYRERKIVNGLADEAEELEIEGPAAQGLVREGGVWRLEAPFETGADATAARNAARLVAEVEVERYVAERAEEAHGFAKPYAKVTARFAARPGGARDAGPATAGKSATLEIGAGAAPDGSRFARFQGGDGLVFVLKKEKIDAITVPLVARDLIALEAGDLAKVTIHANGGSLTALREGGSWKAEGDAADAAALDRPLGELGSIRTIRGASFGPAVGFEAPVLRLEAWTRKQIEGGAAPTVLLFGSKTADPKEDGYTARREGVDVTVIVPSRLVDEIVALVPAAPSAS
jgi:hypothetical protein